jgi:hypothetical protein
MKFCVISFKYENQPRKMHGLKLFLNEAKEEVLGLARLSAYKPKKIAPKWKNISSGTPVIVVETSDRRVLFFLDVVNPIG